MEIYHFKLMSVGELRVVGDQLSIYKTRVKKSVMRRVRSTALVATTLLKRLGLDISDGGYAGIESVGAGVVRVTHSGGVVEDFKLQRISFKAGEGAE